MGLAPRVDVERIPSEVMPHSQLRKNVVSDVMDAVNRKMELEILKKNENNEETFATVVARIMKRGFESEIVKPLEGKTTGEIPLWLNGTLIRNGPGLNKVGQSEYNHLFDFLALLRKFRIKDGRVTFECKFLKSDTYCRNVKAQRIVVDEFGTRRTRDPCQTIFQRFWSTFESAEPMDNCAISVYPYKDEFYALTETPILHRIDMESCESMEKVDLRSRTKMNIVHNSSHPQVTPQGVVCNVGVVVGSGPPKYTVVEFPKTKNCDAQVGDVFSEARVITEVPARWPFSPSYMHSFGMTENHSVLIEQPLGMSILRQFKNKLLGGTISDSMVWFEGYPTLIYVTSISTQKTHVFECEPFAFMHTVNQYEEDHHIILDVCVMKSPDLLHGVTMDKLEKRSRDPKFASQFQTRPMRFILPLKTPKNPSPTQNLVTLPNTQARAFLPGPTNRVHVEPELLADIGVEMPRIQFPQLCGRKYTYFYGVAVESDGLIAKIDTKNKTFIVWNDKDAYASEPIFVARPNQKDEDDGILLTSVIGTASDSENQVSLVVLDAKDLKELGRTEFTLDKPLPMDLHGWFSQE